MMNGRMLTVLTTLAGVLAVGEFASAVQIGLGAADRTQAALRARGIPPTAR
jgi:hypothetical protein